MNIARAESIDGGMNPIELEWLADRACRCQRVVEIGSLRGRSARAMADNMTGDSVLYCVDHFYGSAEHGDVFRDEDLSKLFYRNMSDLVRSGRVCVIRSPSLDAADILRDMLGATLDMVFIDASHDYDSVLTDILAWKPLLRSGGLLSGHDYGHPPIEQVIDKLFGRLPTVPGGSIWYTEIP